MESLAAGCRKNQRRAQTEVWLAADVRGIISRTSPPAGFLGWGELHVRPFSSSNCGCSRLRLGPRTQKGIRSSQKVPFYQAVETLNLQPSRRDEAPSPAVTVTGLAAALAHEVFVTSPAEVCTHELPTTWTHDGDLLLASMSIDLHHCFLVPHFHQLLDSRVPPKRDSFEHASLPQDQYKLETAQRAILPQLLTHHRHGAMTTSRWLFCCLVLVFTAGVKREKPSWEN
ncbi:hypothetical protein IWZ00DRAFT_276440 [Phyllosticta capitalensis]|uniref:uncharacterized protein n=1 Tax=Phyllosticta capitalensis TaxID=121624 RepID=UPI003130A377